MQCSSKTCGYYITPKIAGDKKSCNICGSDLRYDSEDYLRYGVNSLVTESRPSQVQMARLVGDALNKHQILLVEGPVGCHARGQEILMYDGTLKKVEKIQVGDYLASPDGGFKEVTELIRGRSDLVEIVPVKGNTWRVNLKHVLTVVDTTTGVITDITVSAFKRWAESKKADHKLFRVAAYFKPQTIPLPMDPYFLGVVLGDSSLSHARGSIQVTTMDPEIVDVITAQADFYKMRVSANRPIQYNLVRTNSQMGYGKKSSLSAVLTQLDLRPIKCEDRFVPQIYKSASFTARLEILAGLLDTNGSLASNCYDYISKSVTLTNDVAFLARSVGLAAYVKSRVKFAHKRHSVTYYRVSISGNTDIVPTKLLRKKATVRHQKKNVLRTGFKIKSDGRVGEYYGFTLTGDGRYLLEDFTVTHNSGKSLAYSLPAILEGKRVVISTAKKQLQHQLANKDIPAIKAATGSLVQIGMIKGKGNYACQYKINNAGTDIPQSDYRKLVSWMVSSSTGDLSDYPGERPAFWGSITAEDCVGVRCKLRKDCGYWDAKINARTANVIIANHNMVAFDLKFGPGKLLGNYDALVLDEAHQAEEAFRGAYTETVHQFGYRRLLRLMDAAGSVTGYEKQLDTLWPKMFTKLKHQEGKIEKDPFGEEGNEVSILLGAIIKDAVSNMHKLGFGGTAEGNTEDYSGTNVKTVGNDDLAKFEMVKSMATRLYAAIDASRDPHENSVIYITESGAKRYKSVNVAPINMGPLIGPKLRALKSVIITSATMAVGADFSDIRKKLGVDYGSYVTIDNSKGADLDEPKEVVTAVLSSPFNYAEQAALYVPKHTPLPVTSSDPGLQAYYDKLTVEIKRLIEASNGNTFVLFTSNSDLKAIHLKLIQANLKNPLIIQGDDAEAALNMYRTTPNSVLLGSKSFWEGVDVVGNKLRLVIIPKLPFPMMTDPILQGKMKLLTEQLAATGATAATITGQVFNTLQVPKMITDLRQGAGRLIRSKTDMGVLAILDPRVWTGSGKKMPSPTQQNHLGYGAQVINAIGFVNRVSVFDKIKTFLEQLAQRPD